jgi:hypothetical protein
MTIDEPGYYKMGNGQNVLVLAQSPQNGQWYGHDPAYGMPLRWTENGVRIGSDVVTLDYDIIEKIVGGKR